jgi:hypothetical protein
MRRKSDFEIELPWQMEAMIACVSMVISSLAICFGWLALGIVVNTSLEGIYADLGGATPTFLSLTVAWPLFLVAFIGVSVRVYVAIKAAVIRRFESFGL